MAVSCKRCGKTCSPFGDRICDTCKNKEPRKMKLVFAKDCDCDNTSINHYNTTIEHHLTDSEAAERFIELYLKFNGLCTAQHGPSGHLLKVINHHLYDDIPILPPKAGWSVPLEEKPPQPAVCNGPEDPFCGSCRYSTHGCADKLP